MKPPLYEYRVLYNRVTKCACPDCPIGGTHTTYDLVYAPDLTTIEDARKQETKCYRIDNAEDVRIERRLIGEWEPTRDW